MASWNDPRFLEEARSWIRAHVEVTGQIEQTHNQWWSTVMRVPCGKHALWFKAVADSPFFEGPLTALLGRVRPGRVAELVALDTSRGWMLMSDAGVRLRELIRDADDLWRLEEYLPEYADLQIAATGQTEEMRAVGVPDEALATLSQRIDRILDTHSLLMFGQEGGLTGEEHARLKEQIPLIDGLCRELAAYGIEETVQHDDLNDGNVMVRDGRYRTMDWGDACISHPFHTLTVTLRATAFRLRLEPGGAELLRLRDAYLEPFTGLGKGDDLRQAADIAYRTGTLARANFWFRSLGPASPEEREEDVEAVPYGLRKFLENGPMGSWEW